MSVIQSRNKNEYILYDDEAVGDPAELSFSVRDWANRSAIIGFAEGRGTTFFIDYHGRELVLRHYHRGGAVAELLGDRYFRAGLGFSRPWREFRLLQTMQAASLPVPHPVAARVVRQGLFYTADIITQRIGQARTLYNELKENTIDKGHWVALGGVIRHFHIKGFYHADLNVRNILLDQGGRFHLIDFDKGRKRRPAERWQQANLDRFKRSLEKMHSLESEIVYSDENWHWLLQGYLHHGETL